MKRLIITLLFTCWSLFSEETISSTKYLDWENSSVTIDSYYHFNEAFRPPLRLKAQRSLEKEFPGILKNSLLDVTVDSHSTVLDIIIKDTSKLNDIERLFTAASRTKSILSQDFSQMQNTYILYFYPSLAEVFINHSTPDLLRPVMEPVPSGNFSGVLIYAKGLFEVYGESTKDLLHPCLFPKIRNNNSEIILDKMHFSKNELLRRGMVFYTDDINNPAISERIGLVPLRIQAEKIFGKYRTDIILSENDSYSLLSDEYVIQLLITGRIVVVLDLQ